MSYTFHYIESNDKHYYAEMNRNSAVIYDEDGHLVYYSTDKRPLKEMIAIREKNNTIEIIKN